MSYQVVAEAVLRQAAYTYSSVYSACRMLRTLLCRHMMVERSHRVDDRTLAGRCRRALRTLLAAKSYLSSRCIAPRTKRQTLCSYPATYAYLLSKSCVVMLLHLLSGHTRRYAGELGSAQQSDVLQSDVHVQSDLLRQMVCGTIRCARTSNRFIHVVKLSR
jgi:hypothetical protein